VLLALLCISASLDFSRAWGASKPSTHKATMPKALQQSQALYTSSSSTTTATFYQTSSTVPAEEALAMAKAVSSEIYSTTTATQTAETKPESLSSIRNLPWMEEDGPDSDVSQNEFFSHWNWQFSFFEEHLTNLKIREEEHQDESIHDLYYAIKDTNGTSNKSQQRVYTISLESDEYRDIRMTYMHCPAMQTFRCLSYPRNGGIPIMGMGLMKMGGSRNLAILDYQPLPPTDETEETINETYTSELLRLRQEVPSMSQPMSKRHFDSNEERKYFTESPLLGRLNELEATDTETEEYRQDLLATQKKYVAKHTELTQLFGNGNSNGEKSNPLYVLERHSDFDTHVSEREPAGPFLCGVFGPETGGKLVHNVIYPLSTHGLNGEGKKSS